MPTALMTLYQTVTVVLNLSLIWREALVQGNLHGGDTSVLTLEHIIFYLSTNPQLTQAVFYMLPIYTHGKLHKVY